MSVWKDIEKEKPIATETGDWDGRKSGRILVIGESNIPEIGTMYEGIMDGNKFCDFYDDNDYEIKGVRLWTEIPEL